jgi:AraC-like DNA-binding protein
MMSLSMNSFTHGPVILGSWVPAELSGLVLPGSETGYVQGAFGKILLQEIHLGELTILYNIYQLKKDMALDFHCHPGMMQTYAALKNDCHYYIKETGDFCLTESQFNILDASDIKGTQFLEHDREYRSFHVIYSPEILDELLPLFPVLEEWFASDSSQPRLFFKTNPQLTDELKNIMDDILHCSYTNELRRFYLEIMAREFLFLSIIPAGREITPVTRLSRRSIELIHESKLLLETSFDQRITIALIAKKAGINEFKLKAGFKKIFGISMFDHLIETKMKIAQKLLLETNKPIKEIASLTGYTTTQGFLKAFKKCFHYTPASFRKN